MCSPRLVSQERTDDVAAGSAPNRAAYCCGVRKRWKFGLLLSYCEAMSCWSPAALRPAIETPTCQCALALGAPTGGASSFAGSRSRLMTLLAIVDAPAWVSTGSEAARHIAA